jgi:hypothetical protein
MEIIANRYGFLSINLWGFGYISDSQCFMSRFQFKNEKKWLILWLDAEEIAFQSREDYITLWRF